MKTKQIFNNKQRVKLLHRLAVETYKRGNFTLTSGRKSKHYVNCKPLTLSGSGLALISIAMLEHVEQDALAVAGLTLGADPLVSAVAMAANLGNQQLDALIVRKQAKIHGTNSWIEGPLPPVGSLITVLEDVVTTGGSSLKAVNKLIQEGYQVKRVVTIVDREEGGEGEMKENGIELISLYQLSEIAAYAAELTE